MTGQLAGFEGKNVPVTVEAEPLTTEVPLVLTTLAVADDV